MSRLPVPHTVAPSLPMLAPVHRPPSPIHRQRDQQTDRQIDRQTDRRTNERTDRPTKNIPKMNRFSNIPKNESRALSIHAKRAATVSDETLQDGKTANVKLRVNSNTDFYLYDTYPPYCMILAFEDASSLTATHCNTLQHTATHCNMHFDMYPAV